jgi:hypothetical protein
MSTLGIRERLVGCWRLIGNSETTDGGNIAHPLTVAHQVQVSVILSWLGTTQVWQVQFPEAGVRMFPPRCRVAATSC